jgi:hypothetical protein
MFERYTESARRSIFFARYEASQYGSPRIEAEHLLLGILREDKRLAGKLFPEMGAGEAIRKEVEAQILRGQPISTSVEMPLSQHSKLVLNFAADSAEQLEHREVDTVHLILGILRVDECPAARILKSRRVTSDRIRDKIEQQGSTETWRPTIITGGPPAGRRAALRAIAEKLVEIWTVRDAVALSELFAPAGQFWDSRGQSWSGSNLRHGLESQFASQNLEVEQVELKQMSPVARDAAVVTLRLTATDKSSQQLIAFLQDLGRTWQIASAHLSLVEPS